MTAKTFSSWTGPSWEKQWTKMIFISIVLHLFILALFLNIIPSGGTAKKLEPAYFVDLVSFPGGGSIGNSLKAEKPFDVPSPPPPQIESKPVSIPKPVPEKPLQVEDRSKTLDQAMEQLKKKVQQEKSLGKTLSRLEDRVKGEEALEKALDQIEKKKRSGAGSRTEAGPGGSGSVSIGGLGGQDGMGIENQLYYASLVSRINRNWSLPEGLLKGKDISAVVVIHISRNGKIVDVKFEKKSGVEAFDQEVRRTLNKSDPLPPPPINIFEGVGLTFSSKGLSRK